MLISVKWMTITHVGIIITLPTEMVDVFGTQLEATNPRFQKRPGKLWTFLSDAVLTKTQLDYVLVRKKWRNSVKNTEPYNFFSSLGSDHRVVVSDIKLSLRTAKTPPRRVI